MGGLQPSRALELRQVCAFGLRVIEDVNGAKANQNRRGLRFLTPALFLLGCVFPAAVTNNRGKNLDAFFAFLYKPAQLVPSADTGNAGSRRALPRDGENVAKV